MIASNDISFHPAILHMRHMIRQAQPSLALSLLDNEPFEHLIGSLTTQDSLDMILNQQLFGSLSSQVDVDVCEQKNDLRHDGNKVRSKTDHKTESLPKSEIPNKHSTSVEQVNKDVREKQSTTDSIACIERLWKQWQNQPLSSENGRFNVSKHEQRNASDKPLVSMRKNHAMISTTIPVRLFSSSSPSPTISDKSVNAVLSTPAMHLMKDVQKALTQLPQTTLHSTSIAASSSVTAGKTAVLTPTALTQLVDQLWTTKSDEIKPASVKPQANSKTATTQASSVQSPSSSSSLPSIVKHSFQSEVENRVKTMGLKPISATTTQTNTDENITSKRVATTHSNIAIDNEYELLNKINQMLLEQAQRNGVDIS